MTTQNLWDTAKEGILQQYKHTSRNEKNIINNQTLHLKQIEKEEQQKTLEVSRTEIIKI